MMTHYQRKVAENKLNRELKRLGCPYENADPRSSPWLEGYWHGLRKGLNDGADIAREVLAA